jgi:hypothetical protein
MMKLKLVFATAVALFATAAHAQLSVTLLPAVQSGSHGGTVSYEATLTNIGTGALDITGSSFTVIGSPAGLNIDDSPLFINFPGTFAAGDSFTAVLFNAFIGDAATIPAGDYFGDFTVQTSGGETPRTWQLTVTEGTSAPEPGSLLLFLGGTLVIICRRYAGRDRSGASSPGRAGA